MKDPLSTEKELSEHQKAMRRWALGRMKECRECGGRFLSTAKYVAVCWRCERKRRWEEQQHKALCEDYFP